MTDRELLELAAKAAGIEVWFPRLNGGKNPDGTRIILTPCYTEIDRATVEWNPLVDDALALRLAVRLNLSADFFYREILVGYTPNRNDCEQVVEEEVGTDPYAATRRAIVRAAAEIGKAMK